MAYFPRIQHGLLPKNAHMRPNFPSPNRPNFQLLFISPVLSWPYASFRPLQLPANFSAQGTISLSWPYGADTSFTPLQLPANCSAQGAISLSWSYATNPSLTALQLPVNCWVQGGMYLHIFKLTPAKYFSFFYLCLTWGMSCRTTPPGFKIFQ